MSEREPRDARSLAWDVLERWQNGDIDRLDDGIACLDHGDERDLALTRELVFGCLRYQGLYDFLAKRFLKRGQHQPEPLMRALRLAAHQLFALDRIPPHAVGNVMVELLRDRGMPKLTGVANAVIRKLASLRQEVRQGEGPEGRLPPEVLPSDPALRHSLPRLLVDDLAAAFEVDPRRSLGDLNRVPHLCTRTRHGRTLPKLRGIIRQQGPWTWWNDPTEVLRGPVADGLCVVQDFSQGAVVDASGVRPNDRVLDVCAAPGGKTQALLERGAQVFAADMSIEKVAAMRMDGIEAIVVVQDGTKPALASASFDVVLVDSPCSNSGVMARRPEARFRYKQPHLASLNALQKSLLAASADLVKADGRLVYSTCSVSPRENQAIAHALPGWRLLSERLSWPDEWQGGGYVAVMVRSA